MHDAQDDSTPVNLELAPILTQYPAEDLSSWSASRNPSPLRLPAGSRLSPRRCDWCSACLGWIQGLSWCRKVDRSVTGLIARQQCCGPLQLPVSDVAVMAQSHFGVTGAAIAIGEQPIKSAGELRAGARMAVGEALTNMVWARISDLAHIKCSVNWMWAAKTAGRRSGAL